MRDMIFRFKPAATPVGRPVADVNLTEVQTHRLEVTPMHGFAEGRTMFQLSESAMEPVSAPPLTEGLVLPTKPEAAPDEATAAAVSLKAEGPVGARPSALLRRFGVEHLSGEDALAARHALILQRLCVVRDSCEVVIAGRDRVVRIVMANGRVMAATFGLPGRKERLVSFRKKQAGRGAAREFAVLLAELCAASGDMLMTECPASGVFDAAAGMVVGELVAAAGLGPVEADGRD